MSMVTLIDAPKEFITDRGQVGAFLFNGIVPRNVQVKHCLFRYWQLNFKRGRSDKKLASLHLYRRLSGSSLSQSFVLRWFSYTSISFQSGPFESLAMVHYCPT